MAQLIAFLIGVITSTTTSLGDKTNAALRMVGLGHQDDIPEGYESLIPAGTTVSSTGSSASRAGGQVQAAPVDHGLIGNWAHAMVSDHPLLTLALAALLGLYLLYKTRQITAVLAPHRQTPSNPHYAHTNSRTRYRKD